MSKGTRVLQSHVILACLKTLGIACQATTRLINGFHGDPQWTRGGSTMEQSYMKKSLFPIGRLWLL